MFSNSFDALQRNHYIDVVLEIQAKRLGEVLDSLSRVLVAYSGGVDSACLLKAAHERLAHRALGIIADTPSLPREELKSALKLANSIGAEVEVVQTAEFSDPNYLANPMNRCYFCKHALFERMEQLARERGFPVLAYGENADDAAGLRPGAGAAAKFQVRAPLKEAGLTKEDVRVLSRHWGLPTAEKPASPCLSSRIPHGTPVTLSVLAQIEAGEAAIRVLGFHVFRLRHHGARARIEFAPEELSRAQSDPWRREVFEAALAAGYRDVEIDPRGYRLPHLSSKNIRCSQQGESNNLLNPDV